MPTLLIAEPGHPLRRVAVGPRGVLVGSLALNDVPLARSGVHKQHLELTATGEGELRFVTCSGATPPRLDGHRCHSGALREGHVLELAGALFLIDRPLRTPPPDAEASREQSFEAAMAVFELAEGLLEESPSLEVLGRTLRVLLDLFGATRGVLLDKGRGRAPPRVLLQEGDWPRGDRPRMSRRLFKRVVKTGEPILVADVAGDPATSGVDSIALEMRTVIAGPLVRNDELLGVVYLESPSEAPAFGETERHFLERFCRFAARLLKRAQETGELRAEARRLKELRQREQEGPEDLTDLIGTSPGMEEVRQQVRQVAATPMTTLLLGESGTGKELVARAIHRLSPRFGEPFVAINCTALPADLVESELFGHVAGAFSGAQEDRAGRFELAHRGTLFLDEVGDLPPQAQAKLLRALQEKTIQRVGEGIDRPVDVRIVAATNAPLAERIVDGSFREDLFFRLNVFCIKLPPLRDRPGDIPLLARSFLQRFSHEMGRTLEGIRQDALQVLLGHDWPGNVRELANLLQQAVVRESGPLLTPSSLVFTLGTVPSPRGMTHHGFAGPSDAAVLDQTFDVAVARFQIGFLEQALTEAGGDVQQVLRRTGLSKASFYRKCASLGIEPARFRKGRGS